MKQLIITFLLIFAIMPSIKSQVSPTQGPPCPLDGKFEYDDFERQVIDYFEKNNLPFLPELFDLASDCRNSSNPELCLEEVLAWADIANPKPDKPKDKYTSKCITILKKEVPTITPNGTIVAETPDQHPNDEDLNHSWNGDISMVRSDMQNKNEFECWQRMYALFRYTTFGMGDVSDIYLDKFRYVRTGTPLFNQKLSEKVMETPEMEEMILKFGELFNSELKANGGNLPSKKLRFNYYLQFSGYQFSGLKILVNGTEQSFIEMLDYDIDKSTGTWTVKFFFDIRDNFGLDPPDLKYQTDPPSGHSGFATWYMLQYKYDHIPFVTKIRVNAEISGNYNCQ